MYQHRKAHPHGRPSFLYVFRLEIEYKHFHDMEHSPPFSGGFRPTTDRCQLPTSRAHNRDLKKFFMEIGRLIKQEINEISKYLPRNLEHSVKNRRRLSVASS